MWRKIFPRVWSSFLILKVTHFPLSSSSEGTYKGKHKTLASALLLASYNNNRVTLRISTTLFEVLDVDTIRIDRCCWRRLLRVHWKMEKEFVKCETIKPGSKFILIESELKIWFLTFILLCLYFITYISWNKLKLNFWLQAQAWLKELSRSLLVPFLRQFNLLLSFDLWIRVFMSINARKASKIEAKTIIMIISADKAAIL